MKIKFRSPINRSIFIFLNVILILFAMSLACNLLDDEKPPETAFDIEQKITSDAIIEAKLTQDVKLTQQAILTQLAVEDEEERAFEEEQEIVIEEDAPQFGQQIDDQEDSTLTEYLIQDETFSPDNWNLLKIADDVGDGVATAGQASGGNPGTYRKIHHEWSGPGDILSVHLSAGSQFDPSKQGEITSLDFTYDLILIEGGSSNAVSYRPLLYQNGIYFLSGPAHNTMEPNWQSFSSLNLTAENFSAVGDPNLHPDFSASASPIQFGIIAGNGRDYDGRTATESGIDNWSVKILASLP